MESIDRPRVFRGIGVLVAAVSLGVFALGSADAAKKPLTKKKAVKLFAEEGDVLWAKVASNGSLEGGDGATAATPDSEGIYLVTFERAQAPCAKLATTNDDPGFFVTTDGAADPNTVQVTIQDASSNPANHEFSVALLC